MIESDSPQLPAQEDQIDRARTVSPGNVRLVSVFASVALASAGIFWCYKIPHNHELMSVPETALLLSPFPLLFYWQSLASGAAARRIAGIASCLLWVAGIGLAFVVKADSPLIPVPDTLLLLGFLPLLFLWRFSWTWLVFGACNLGIGMLLMAAGYLPDNLFPSDLVTAKHHLTAYHKPLTWLIIGLLSSIFGTVRITNNIAISLRRRKNHPFPK